MYYALEILGRCKRYIYMHYFNQILRKELLFIKVNIILLFSQATSGLNPMHILEPECKRLDDNGRFPKRSLIEKYPSKFRNTNLELPALSCRVRSIFHIFMQCNDNLTISISFTT
jgi:hypothetical protein